LRLDLKLSGDFSRIHPLPQSGADVPDDLDARLVVLGVDYPYSKEAGSAAEMAANAILKSRGATPRLFQNALVFLAVDRTRLQDLDDAARRHLAWQSILSDKETLDLSPHQVRQAEAQLKSADGAATARIPEAYQWLLVPAQKSPQSPIEWQSFRLSGQDALAVRASKKLRNDELLVTTLAGTRLRMELDRVPLWRDGGDRVAIRQLVEDFARYPYLPRLKDPSVLLGAARDGLGLMLWRQDSFAYADSYDEAADRYRGLRCGERLNLSADNHTGLLVRAEVAARQWESEAVDGTVSPEPTEGPIEGKTGASSGRGSGIDGGPPVAPPASALRRFHGTVALEPTRVGRDAGRIADEVIAHLVGLVGARVTVTLEIAAEIPSGTPDHVVRTVTENSRTLRFRDAGFEQE